jgi:hypothetical protein
MLDYQDQNANAPHGGDKKIILANASFANNFVLQLMN